MKTLYRYFRRVGLRWGAWGVRFAIIAGGLLGLHVTYELLGGNWIAVALLVALVGIFRISEAIENRVPATLVIKASNVDVGDDAKLIISTAALSEATDRVVRDEFRKANA